MANAATSNLLLIDQTRENLRKVVKGMPARERVYGEIKARAATRFAPMTVSRILGADAGAGLIAGSYAISGAFTREAWEQYVDKAVRDAATQESSSTDWVLNVAANDDLTLEGSPEQIRKLLVGMYKQEFIKEWQQFLQGVAIREMTGFDQAVSAMDNLGDPQNSGLRKLLETVYEQTSWDNPALINAGLSKAAPGVMDKVKSLWSRTTSVPVDVLTAGADAQMPQLSVGPVAREFAGVARIMMNRDGATLLKGYLDTLSKLRTRFNQIKNEGDPGPGSRQLMQQTIEGNGSELAVALKYVDEQMLTGMEGAQRQVLRPLLVRPLLQGYAVIIKPASAELNKVWDAQVYQLFQRTLVNKYPFDARAKVEASATEIAQVFGPEGAVSQYVTSALGPLVVRRGDMLSPRVWGEEGLRLSPELVRGFGGWVAPLAGGAASGATAQQQTLFQIQPRPSPGVTEYTIDIDGQRLNYRNTPAQWSNFVWPNQQGTPGAKVVAQSFDGRSVELVNEPGNFGLERLVNTAKREKHPDGSFELTWGRDGVAVSVLLRIVQSPQASTQEGDSPQGNRLRNLALPSLVVEIPAASGNTAVTTATAGGQP